MRNLKEKCGPPVGPHQFRTNYRRGLPHMVPVVAVVPAVHGPAVGAPPVLPPARVGRRRYKARQHCEGSEKYGKPLDIESHGFSLLLIGPALICAHGSKTPEGYEGSSDGLKPSRGAARLPFATSRTLQRPNRYWADCRRRAAQGRPSISRVYFFFGLRGVWERSDADTVRSSFVDLPPRSSLPAFDAGPFPVAISAPPSWLISGSPAGGCVGRGQTRRTRPARRLTTMRSRPRASRHQRRARRQRRPS